MLKHTTVLLLLSVFFTTIPVTAQFNGKGSLDAPSRTLPITDYAKTIVEAPQVSQVEFSPGGTHILYAMKRASVSENQHVTELLVQAVGDDGTAVGEPVRIERVVQSRGEYYFNARWCPDGKSVSYLANFSGGSIAGRGVLSRYDLGTGRTTPLPINDEVSEASTGARPRITTIGRDYKWSPTGKLIAFTAVLSKSGRLAPTTGVRVEGALLQNNLSFNAGSKIGLFLLDPETGRLEQLSPDTVDVRGFDWAPNEQSVVAVVRTGSDKDIPLDSSDLVLIERTTRSVRTLVAQPGQDIGPVWSPDGKWIAFSSSFGVPGESPSLAVVPSAGGKVVRLAGADPDDVRGSILSWTPDSRGFYFDNSFHMTRRLLRADVASGRVTSLPVEEGASAMYLSLSPDARRLAYVHSTPNSPPQLFVRNLIDGSVKQVTRLPQQFALTSQVNSKVIEWPSKDGKFTIHGVLLTPEATWNKTAPLPTLVWLMGGPEMVRAGYAIIGGNAEILSLATRGYAVLIPNTRGRGGYGKASGSEAFKNGKSFARLPYEDLMAGVEYLIESGVADPERLGILGHSWGGYLTAYAVTQTKRFRAAVNYEGAYPNLVGEQLAIDLPGTNYERAAAYSGLDNPFAPDDLARLISESPAFNMHRVVTPTLLLFGERSPFKQNGRIFYSAPRRFGIPVEFVLYDEGHGFELPTAQVDYVKRIGDWFDYWVRDMPYPDAKLQSEYDAWRAKNQKRDASATGEEKKAAPATTTKKPERKQGARYYPMSELDGRKLPFSEAVQVGDMLYVSGQIGNDSGSLKLVPGGIVAESRQAIENVKGILERNGSSLDRVIKCTIFLSDIADWPAFNDVYRTYFTTNLPARSALGCNGLAFGAKVELECIAVI